MKTSKTKQDSNVIEKKALNDAQLKKSIEEKKKALTEKLTVRK